MPSMQAVASRELGAFHPAVHAGSVQQWMRARASMFSGPCASHTFSRTRGGCVSPDFRLLARLSGQALLVDSLCGQGARHQHVLPSLQQHYSLGAHAWDPSSRHIKLLLGRPFSSYDAGKALMFLDTATGSVVVVHLAWVTAQSSPDRGLVLVCYQDAEEHTFAAVYDCRGERVSVVGLPAPTKGRPFFRVDWSPAGRAVIVRTMSDLYLWEFSTGAPLQGVRGLGSTQGRLPGPPHTRGLCSSRRMEAFSR